ncbi:hypothetical protein ACFL0U_02670 [Pseudomonadota bacterium]
MNILQIAHKKFFKNSNGLTFMELSIAILLLSIIATATTLFYTSLYESKVVSTTEENLYKIERALNAYLLENGHLPCPANPTTDVRAFGFGTEETVGGKDTACNGALSSNDIYYGVVPVKALKLRNKYALDGWGNKISYFVRLDFATDEATFTTTSYNSATNLEIYSNGTTGTETEANAIYVLVSHGYNGRGAYSDDGGQIEFSTKVGESVLDESYLSEETNIYQSSFDSILVQDLYDENFDDILLFKTKMDLVYDAGWEGIGCLGDEIDDTEYSVNGTDMGWTGATITDIGVSLASDTDCSVPSGNYVSLNPNTVNTPERVCGPYGQWSNVVYECILGCVVSITNPAPDTYYMAEGTDVYEECPPGEVGQIIHSCPVGGGTATQADGCS